MDRRVLPIGLLLLLASAAVLTVSPSAVAEPNTTPGFEGFESFEPLLEAPSSNWYTYQSSAVNAFVSQSEAYSGTKSLRWAPTAATALTYFYNVPGFNWCHAALEGDALTFKMMKQVNQNSADVVFRAVSQNAQTPGAVMLSIDPTGAVSGGGSTMGTMAADTWYDFQLWFLITAGIAEGCDGGYTYQLCAASQAFEYSQCTTAAAGTINAVLDGFLIEGQDAAAPYAGEFYFDDLTFIGATPAPGLDLVAEYTIAAGGDVVGWDVDLSGTNLIYRYDSVACGATTCVATLPAQTLSEELATFDTGCNRIQGVTAGIENVAYTRCATNVNEVSHINIQVPDLSTTFIPEACGDTMVSSAEDWQFDLTGITGIASLEFGGVDYNLYDDDGAGACAISMVMGFSDTDGKVGFLLSVIVENTKIEEVRRTQYTSSGQGVATQIAICEPAGSNPVDDEPVQGAYLIAVHGDQPTRTWHIQPESTSGGIGATMTLVSSGSGQLGSAASISCTGGSGPALLQTPTKVFAYNYRTGTVAASRDGTAGCQACAAESWDGKWGAVVLDGAIHVLNMTTLNTTSIIEFPVGVSSIDGLQMDSTGQSLWGLGDTSPEPTFYKWDITPATTVLPVAPGDVTPGGCHTTEGACTVTTDADDGSPPPGSTFLGNNAENVQDALGVFADLGAILSLAILGILPLWVILLGALVAAVFVVLRLKG